MTRNRILVVAATVVVVALGVWALWPRRGPAPVRSAARIAPIAPKVPAVMLINSTRDGQAGPATPMFLECVITNRTLSDLPIRLSSVAPVVRDAAGTTLPVTWEVVDQMPTSLSPGTSVHLRWVGTTRIPAGEYTIDLDRAAEAIDAAIGRLQVEPARLHVSDTTDADQDEAAAIQLLAWRGQGAEALARLENALNATPDALVLQLWRGDLLGDLGRQADAVAQYQQLGAAIDERQRRNPAFTPEFPFWLSERINGGR